MEQRTFNNRLEEKLFHLKNSSMKRVGFVLISVFVVLVSMLLTKPSVALAASGTVIDFQPNLTNSSPIAEGPEANADDALAYTHPIGSGSYSINAMVMKLARAGSPTAGARLRVRVYEGGDAPDSFTGAIVASGSITLGTICTSASPGCDTEIIFGNTFTLSPGETYWFKVWSDTSTSDATMYYAITGNNGTRPFYANFFGGNWVKRTNFQTRLKLFGEEQAVTSLTLLTNPPYFENQSLLFNIQWQSLGFDPLFFAFLPDQGDGTGTIINNNYDQLGAFFTQSPSLNPIGSSGSFNFTASITVPNDPFYPYTPTVILTDCGIWPLQSGCNYEIVTMSTSIDINSGTYSLDFEYPSSLYSGNTIIKVGDSIRYYYDVDSGICTPGSISGMRIFKGYSYPQIDSGSILLTTSGSISLQYPATGNNLKPKITVYCDTSISHDLFLGSTWDSTKAIPVYVLTESEFDQATNVENYANGNTGSGGYTFFSDRSGYSLYQNVNFKWTFNYFSSGTITNVRFYKDRVKLPQDYTDFTDPNDLDKSRLHRFVTTYSLPNQYQPSVVISSATQSIEIYLGGGQSPDPNYAITIFNQSQSTVGLGGILGKFGTGGIFGITTFSIPTNESMNALTLGLVYVANQSIQGLVGLANFAYGLLLESNFFRWWADAIAPPPSSRTAPSSVLGIDIGTVLVDRDFTITYSSTDSAQLSNLFLLLVVIAFAVWIGNKLVH